jgi:hypothetical protein
VGRQRQGGPQHAGACMCGSSQLAEHCMPAHTSPVLPTQPGPEQAAQLAEQLHAAAAAAAPSVRSSPNCTLLTRAGVPRRPCGPGAPCRAVERVRECAGARGRKRSSARGVPLLYKAPRWPLQAEGLPASAPELPARQTRAGGAASPCERASPPVAAQIDQAWASMRVARGQREKRALGLFIGGQPAAHALVQRWRLHSFRPGVPLVRGALATCLRQRSRPSQPATCHPRPSLSSAALASPRQPSRTPLRCRGRYQRGDSPGRTTPAAAAAA